MNHLMTELRRAWLDSGRTQQDISDAMEGKCFPQQVAQWLNGKYDPKVENFIRLANALGYDVVLQKR